MLSIGKDSLIVKRLNGFNTCETVLGSTPGDISQYTSWERDCLVHDGDEYCCRSIPIF